MSTRTTLAGAARFQLAVLRRSSGDLIVLATTPLLTVTFLAILRHAGRHDIQAYAVLGPAVMALWSIGVLVCGDIVDTERAAGTLELLLASPASLPIVVFARIATVTALSLVSVPEAWLVAALGFRVTITINHPLVFLLTLLCGALATAGWAAAMAGAFVLARSARLFQNAISYPIFVLGGAVVPIALLPLWLRWLSRLVYLSWTSDLLRDSVRATPIGHPAGRLGMVLALGALGLAVGLLLLERISVRVRGRGELGFA